MLSAPVRRELVRQMTTQGLSERRAPCVVRMSAGAYRYATRPDRNVELRQQIVALVQRHKCYGVGTIHLKLRQAGLPVNDKRVEGCIRKPACRCGVASGRRCHRVSASH